MKKQKEYKVDFSITIKGVGKKVAKKRGNKKEAHFIDLLVLLGGLLLITISTNPVFIPLFDKSFNISVIFFFLGLGIISYGFLKLLDLQ